MMIKVAKQDDLDALVAVEAMRALARIGKLKPCVFAGGGTPAYVAAPRQVFMVDGRIYFEETS